MPGWIPFRDQSLAATLEMVGRIADPRQHLWLGLRENTYLIPTLLLTLMLLAYAAMIAFVFVFLRPINQFIYFQF